MVHCGCRHPSFFGLVLVERHPHYFVPGVMEPSHLLWLRLTVFRANLFRARPRPESYLQPTRPPRRPAPYTSGTLPGVTPPSGPRLISVCIHPSPRARLSVGVVERDGSRFLRPDPPPWWGRRGSGTSSTSRECPPSVTPTPYPRPFRHLSMLPWWPWHRSSWDPVDSPLVRNLTSLVPSSLSLLW